MKQERKKKLFLAATRFSVAKSGFGGILIEIVRHYRTDRPTDIIWPPPHLSSTRSFTR